MACSNWERIVDEEHDNLEKVYRCERSRKLYRFFGIVHGHDDYYYGMSGMEGQGMMLLSCVGSIEGHGFKRLDDYIETRCPWCGEESLTLETYSDKFGPKSVLVEDLEHYVCSNDCLNDYETPQQLRDRCDKIDKAYNGLSNG